MQNSTSEVNLTMLNDHKQTVEDHKNKYDQLTNSLKQKEQDYNDLALALKKKE